MIESGNKVLKIEFVLGVVEEQYFVEEEAKHLVRNMGPMGLINI